MLSEKRNKIVVYSIFSIVFLLMLVINIYTPYWGDDYVYTYMMDRYAGSDLQHITNLWQIFPSQFNHYFTHNGRLIIHGLDQLFLLMPKMVFNICNALMFCCLVWLCWNNVVRKDDNLVWKYATLISLFVVLFFYIPQSWVTVTWQTGALNYLWTATGVLFFVLLMQYTKNHTLKYLPLWVVVSFFIGWGHEGVSVGIAGACVLYSILRHKEVNKQMLWLGIAFCVGSIILVLSPGLWHRSTEGDMAFTMGLGILSTLKTLLLGSFLPVFRMLLIVECAYVCIFPKRWWTFVKSNLFYHLAIVVWIGFSLLTQFVGQGRAMIGLEVVCIILIARIIYPLLINKKHYWAGIIAAICVVCLGLDYSSIIQSNHQRYYENEEMINRFVNRDTTRIYIPSAQKKMQNSRMNYCNFVHVDQWNQFWFSKFYDPTVKRIGENNILALDEPIYHWIYNDEWPEEAQCVADNFYYLPNQGRMLYILSDSIQYDSQQKVNVDITIQKQRQGIAKRIADWRHKSDVGGVSINTEVISVNGKQCVYFDDFRGSWSYPVLITNIKIHE